MNGKIKALFVTFCIAGLAVILGCASIMDAITPCYIPQEVIQSVDANVPIIPFMPFTSLFDARYVKTRMYFQYLLHNNLMTTSIAASEAFQQRLFSPEGPLGLLLPGSMFATLGLFAGGRFLKSPREKELEVEVNGKKTV